MDVGMISVDRWSEGSQVYFLTHLHADHTNGLSSTWKRGPLFCSRITAKLFSSKFPGFKLSLLRILDVGQWNSIPLVSPTTESNTTINVIAIDAHHCPGAVMYLFRGEFGCMLYTGDFRWETTSKRAEIGRSMLLSALGNDKVDILYLDNTYCNPSYSFPSREVAAQQVVDVIASHPEHDIIIGIDSLGKEDLLLHIAQALKIKIWVWPERLQIMHLLGFHDIFTTKVSLTRVRAVPRYSFSIDTLEGLNMMRPTIGIMPSGLPWKPLEGNTNVFGSSSRHSRSKLSTKVGSHTDMHKPNDNSRTVESYHEYIFTVPYSDHSCFAEIKEFVKLVQPTNLKGIVSSSSSYVDPLYYFGRLPGANLQSQGLRQNFVRKGHERVKDVLNKSTLRSDNSTEAGMKRRSKKYDFLGVHVIANMALGVLLFQEELGTVHRLILRTVRMDMNLEQKYHLGIIRQYSYFMFSVFFLCCISFTNHLSHGADTISTNQSLFGDHIIVSAGGNFAMGFYKPVWFLAMMVMILRDGSNSTQPIWQSFDYLVHTWLPGSKISYNKRANTHQSLTSWKNSEDPSPGLFSHILDANNSYVLLWNGSKQYWTDGPWNGEIFSLLPTTRQNYMFNISFVDNENESYLKYSPYDPYTISRVVMDVSGQLKQLTWLEGSKEWNLFWAQPRQQCDVYALCGPFGTCNQNTPPFCNCLTGFNPKSGNDWYLGDYSGGCVRRTKLQCGNASAANQEKDRFREYSNMRLPEHPQSVASGSATECESSCLKNCSCTAYAYDRNGCSIWTMHLVNLQQLLGNDSSGSSLYLRLAASEFSRDNNMGIIIGVVGSVVVLGFVYVMWKQQRRLIATPCVLWPNTFWLSFLGKDRIVAVYGSLVAFRYKDLQKATKNFSEKMGSGGFGSVFKGTLPDSAVIAVKKLESINQGEKQFRAEVNTLGTIQHINLVQLRGFCSEGNKKLLVYDYMQNGSLDSHLFHGKESKVLDWKTRYQIALGTARGLAYLHEECRDCIVADFGLAKLIGRELSRVLTTMRGTTGYLVPEWIVGVAITPKADVYSYGMMLFELISGRRNSDQPEAGIVKFFPIQAASVVIEGGDVHSLLDHMLEKHVDVEEAWRICKVACWCIQDDGNDRPSMGQVVQILEGILDVNPPPIPRFLQALVNR
ncbi:unnamed protein product [Camellia sinensis]